MKLHKLLSKNIEHQKIPRPRGVTHDAKKENRRSGVVVAGRINIKCRGVAQRGPESKASS